MDKKILFQVLDRVAEKHARQIAIEEEGRSTTYGEIKRNSNGIAACLLSEGLRKGEEVATFLKCGATYVTSVLGINKAGGLFMALDIEYPIKRTEFILNHISPRVIITDEQQLPALLDLLTELGLTHSYVERILVITKKDTAIRIGGFKEGGFRISRETEYPEHAVEMRVEGDDSMYLVNTSGSTGTPKMIEGRHKSLSHFIHWEVSEFGLDERTRGCVLARPSFDLSLREIFAPLLAGGTLCVPEPEVKAHPLKLVEWMGKYRINLFHPIPSIFRQMMKEIRQAPELSAHVAGLQNILFAGEALFGRDIAEWRSIGGRKAALANLYGPSETTLAKICHRIGDNEYQPNEIIPLGKPLPNTSILIIADELLCSPNVIGEIFIKTPFRSKGYYKDAVMTGEKFIQNPLHNDYEDIVYQTGDLAKYAEDGTIVFSGRRDSQVKIRGNRVELSEIEKVLLTYPHVKQVVVLPVKRADGDNVLTCYYIGDAYIDQADLRAFLKDYLPEYMFPSFYIHLDEFPLNLNGKIDRRALPKPEELLYDQLVYEAPTNGLEEKLAVMWGEVLNLKKVGINNSFYELGGHSLSVTRVLTRIYKELGIEISLKEIFDNATIKKLALLLSGKQRTTFRTIGVLSGKGDYELSYAQRSIWMLSQVEKDLTAYHIPIAATLYGKLDVADLEKAFVLLVGRHESLRTSFLVVDGEPRQRVKDDIDFHLDYIREEVGEQEEEACIARHFGERIARPLDLENGPLFNVLLIRTAEDKHLLLFNIHHIICDGWSVMVLMNDITALYNGIRSGKAEGLAPLRIQYKDYAHWLNEGLAGEKGRVAREFWSARLAGDLSLVGFPHDHDPAHAAYNGDTIRFGLEPRLSAQIGEIRKRYGATPFVTFLAAIYILLFKYTGKRDLVVGTPLAGRDHADLEGQVGIFVNVLPVRNEIDAADTFESLLLKVRQTVLDTYEHQLYPLDLMSELVSVRGDRKNLKLFDILVQSQSFVPVQDEGLSEIYIKPYPLSNKTSKVDLTFDISPDGRQSHIVSIEFNSDLFEAGTILLIRDNLLNILGMALADPAIRIYDIPLIASTDVEEEHEAFKKAMMEG